MNQPPKAAAVAIAITSLLAFLPGTAQAAAPLPQLALFLWQPFLGPFHSVLLHFPIGFVVMAFLVDLFYIRRRSADAQRIVGLILLFAVLTSAMTIFLGLMRSDTAEYDAKVLLHHRNYGIAVGGLVVTTLALHWLAFRGGESAATRRGLRLGFRTFLLASMIVMVIAGHEGGNLTHGTNYLTKNAPPFVKQLIEDAPETSPQPGAMAADAGERFFAEKVKPILDSKCASCHGAEKQKGEYRLDQKEIAFKGGESGKLAIKPGEPLQSHLVNVVLLPADDDDVMPPKGKRTLTSDEVMTLIRWIQQGAPFPEGTRMATEK
jgi:uncharacterized membrane protein/mono/diheme cytochrome c family protein